MIPRLVILLTALALFLAGCGSGDDREGATSNPDVPKPAPALGSEEKEEEPEEQAATDLGFPGFATKNTTRVGGTDSIANAAGVALAVFPSRLEQTRPTAVTLVDARDWRAAISAAQLMSRPLRAPVLLSDGDELPAATETALAALRPTGAKEAGGAQLLRVGDAPEVDGLKDEALPGKGYAEQARAIDRLRAKASGKPSRSVLIASADHPAYAMPAAAWAAKAGTPVLWVRGKEIPAATRAAIRDHGRPRIYLLGPASVVGEPVAKELGKLGRVQRIAGRDAIGTAIEFSKYDDSGFGWNARDPGHGFVFASVKRPADAAAAAPLSASGTYGPLLLVSQADRLDRAVEGHLLDVQPGYDRDPVRGVYNHGWLMGDATTISVDVQSRIDALLEIQPVDRSSQPAN